MRILFTANAPAELAPEAGGGGAVLALFILVAAVVAWFALRGFVRGLRARKAEAAVGADFEAYALEALTNAAKIDGRVNDQERLAIARAMTDLAGAGFDAARVDAAFASARLSKNELVAYLAARSRAFSSEQKVALLKALLSVFVADGAFDEDEHSALLDYTAAVGFDRQSAPGMLRDFARGNIT